jgi:hypothetical protein
MKTTYSFYEKQYDFYFIFCYGNSSCFGFVTLLVRGIVLFGCTLTVLVWRLVRLRSVDDVYKLFLASIPKQCGRPQFPSNVGLFFLVTKQFGTLRCTRTTYNEHLCMIGAYAITFKLRRLSVVILLVLC